MEIHLNNDANVIRNHFVVVHLIYEYYSNILFQIFDE